MARVFISHSSRDNEPAARIKAWLRQQGFDTPFLDFDKHAGIPPGADWERTLYREMEQSEAVIIIQTANWLDSKWCFAEFTQARALGKPIFPIIETPEGATLIAPDIQALDLRKDKEGGLEQLARQLTQIALDAQGGFDWDAGRAPYPGLLAFQEEDAAIYFGRDDDIRRLIERLNARRAQGGAKLLALLGASGSGKSSLLRAGVIPRLRRAGRQWIVVPPMRPQARPVDELARALAVACGPNADWRGMLTDLQDGDIARVLDHVAGDLRVAAGAPEAQVLLPIDQAEELFGAAEPEQAKRFLDILSLAMTGDTPFIGVLAMRSDFLGELQSAERLKARFEEFSLGPMPLGRIPQIIQGPARVAGLRVDEDFVQQAARDAETEDALPLLAFALRELYDRAGADHHLSLDEYRALGDPQAGLTPLENAVRRAADGVLAEARPAEPDLAALREAFVPAMVRVNDQGDYVRRPARWDELPAKAHPLLDKLAKARLLIVRQEGDARSVEVAHEALLRKWPLLRSWLDDAREFLLGRQQLERDLHDWAHAADADKAGALLTGLKLNRARTWLVERPQQLGAEERAYIQASIDHADAAEQRKLRQRRNFTRASVVAAMVLAVAAGLAVWQWSVALRAKEEAVAQTEEARRARNDAVSQAQEARRAKDEAVPWIIRATWRSGAEYKPERGDVAGVRKLIEHADTIINLDKFRFLAPVPIFASGPHGSKFNWESNEFAHYNPQFIQWAVDNLIPGADDKVFRAATQTVYEDHLSTLAHAYCMSYQMLHNDPAVLEDLKREYLALVELKSAAKFLSGLLFNEYFKAMELRAPELGQTGVFPYYSHVAAAFWVRREIDGTASGFNAAIRKLLDTYDPKFAGQCAGITRRFSEVMADGFPGTWRIAPLTYAMFRDDGGLTIRRGTQRSEHRWELVAAGRLKVDGSEVAYRSFGSPTRVSALPGVGSGLRLDRLDPEQPTSANDRTGKEVDALNANVVETTLGTFTRTSPGSWRGPDSNRREVGYTEVGRKYWVIYLVDERSGTEIELWKNKAVTAFTGPGRAVAIGKVVEMRRSP
jgi:hypothetical protein